MPVAVIDFSLRSARAEAARHRLTANLFSDLFGGLRFGGARAGHGGGTGKHGGNDVVIARAATDIPFQIGADHLLAQAPTTPRDDVDGSHDHARRTEAA